MEDLDIPTQDLDIRLDNLAKLLYLVSTHHGDSECGGEHNEGEELLGEQPLGDSSDTDLSEDEPAGVDLGEASADVLPVGDGIQPPPNSIACSWLQLLLSGSLESRA